MDKVIVVLVDGSQHEVPKHNLQNVRRIMGHKIRFVEEEEGNPLTELPTLRKVGVPVTEAPANTNTDSIELANMQMTKPQLLQLATELQLEFPANATKKQLVDLINS